MFAITYEPPSWIQTRTQIEMKNCSSPFAICVHGYELWENSAGQKEGFDELVKFCRYLEERDVCELSFSQIAVMWNGFKKWNRTISPKTVYNPLADAVECQNEKEKHGLYASDTGCQFCHQHETVFSVAIACLD